MDGNTHYLSSSILMMLRALIWIKCTGCCATNGLINVDSNEYVQL